MIILWRRFAGPLALSRSVHVPFLRLINDLDVLLDSFVGEPWPPFEVSCLDGFEPCALGGKQKTSMIEFN